MGQSNDPISVRWATDNPFDKEGAKFDEVRIETKKGKEEVGVKGEEEKKGERERLEDGKKLAEVMERIEK